MDADHGAGCPHYIGPVYGYFGPAGTFTHQALMTLVGDAPAAPYASVGAALDAVRGGEVEASVVPIENSVEGGVSATLDYLGRIEDDPGDRLMIVREAVLHVQFDLFVRPDFLAAGGTLESLRTIITHPHAAAQVRDWLRGHVPAAVVSETGSTAGAAKEVSNPESRYQAAVCATVAGQLYGLVPLATSITDNEGAVTRFVLVAKAGPPPERTGHDKTTLVAYMRADHSGALMEILEQLAVRGVNLCRIESRPTKTTLGSYCFSIDAEGHVHDARLGEALLGLRRICKDVIFLGSYPRADGVQPKVPYGGRDSDYRAAADWLKRVRGQD